VKQTVFWLALKSIRYRRSSILLSIFSIALSVMLLLGIERIRSSVEESFTSTISGTDLIVGARTGNVSLLLSTVFHIGNASQNVSWTSYEKIKKLPQVQWTIPIALGDSHKGYPVVGTTSDFFEHYKYSAGLPLTFKSGSPDISGNSCILGSQVAKKLGYNVNDAIVLTHGMGSEDILTHEKDPFEISGVLAATGTPVDNSIVISLESLDRIHDEFYQYDQEKVDVFGGFEYKRHRDHEHDHDHGDLGSVTGFFLGVKNKSDILSLKRSINDEKDEALLAIMPVVTLLELWKIINPIEKILLIISLLVLIVSLGSVLTAIVSSLNQRRREMAVLRSVGAQPAYIFGLIILESTGIVVTGILLGMAFLVFGLFFTKPILTENFGMVLEIGAFTKGELYMLLAIFVAGIFVGVIPALRSYYSTLSDGLTIKT
jgi:putative ABC transport system permease protein